MKPKIEIDDLDLSEFFGEEKKVLSPKMKSLIDFGEISPAEEIEQRSRAFRHWKPIKLVLVLQEVTCKCGATYVVPNKEPLVRFLHERKGTIWEVAYHPSATKPGLPHDTRTLKSSAEVCEKCWPNYVPRRK